jgi:hypothetical protein
MVKGESIMRYKNYYLITTGNNKSLVLAESGVEAVEIWVESRKREREAEGRTMPFKPDDFTVEKLEREDLVLRASE